MNRIRYVLEELVPPALRDSFLFRWLFRLAWGNHIDALASFRERSAFLTPEEYRDIYLRHPRVQDLTDNSEACITRICGDALGPSVCDVGCGTGHLLETLLSRRAEEAWTAVGVDIVVEEGSRAGIEYQAADAAHLPFPDQAFDTVLCTHTLEHVLDFRAVLAELRRITRQRLIIVVPREREYRYTFNPHFHFFPYRHSLLRQLIPVPRNFVCEDIGRDIYYREDIEKG